MTTHILSSDLLIADVITPLAGNAALETLVARYQLKPGGKQALARAEFDEFSAAIEGRPITIVPGGSSANMLTTLSKLLGEKVAVTFLGIVGKSMYSSMIRQSLAEAHIALLPEMPAGTSSEAAVSYIILLPGGQRTSATYPGNARDMLKPELVSDALVKESDVLLVQGSLWRKMVWEFADRLIALREKHDKELWLTLPTHTKFSDGKPGLFPQLIPLANLVLGNEEELLRIYNTGIEQALRELQKEFRKDALKGKRQRREQAAFITREDKGAAVVTKDDIRYIEALPPPTIANTLGAGDTAFAGFAAGHLAGLTLEDSANIAMALACEKLKFNSARLHDPKGAIPQFMPVLK